jgi:UDP-glucuronate 4-epimerase
MKIFITGVAGFIGSTLAHKLVDMDHIVVGIDNFCEYYDVSLKRAREKRCRARGIWVQECDHEEHHRRKAHYVI